jgi:two-component system, NtrC family, response regulator PilR
LRKLITATLKLSENLETTSQLPQVKLLGRSPIMQQLREMIEKVARSQAPVHIFGESGTGKELVAHLIHEASARRDGPFVPVNCGAIPSELMESELFGHKKGSFTGAVADKQGLIKSAEGGTLFLDEIADLPLHMQVKLLRVIQEKSVRPVGEQREMPVDVRILSATHRNLAQLVTEGKFREDLFYRVNVIEIRVPPLRDRLPDLSELVTMLLLKLSRQLGAKALSITPIALQTLSQYHFPGNVRELENVLERAATLCTHSTIDIADLQLRPKVGAIETVTTKTVVSPGEHLGDALEDLERDAIVRALEQTRYNKTKAAQLLGMSFRSLRYRIKKLGIE